MAAQFRSPAQPKSNQKKPYRPPSPPSPRIFRDFSILRPTFRPALSLSLSPFDSPIDSKARIELENLNFLFSLNLKFRNRIRAVRRTAGRRPPIRSFIIFRSEDRGAPSPFSYFFASFQPSVHLPPDSFTCLIRRQPFLCPTILLRQFSSPIFQPLPIRNLDRSLSLSNSIQFAIFPSSCFLSVSYFSISKSTPSFIPQNFSFQLWTRVAYVSSLRDLLTLSVPFVFATLDRNYYKSPQLRGG